MPSEEYEIYKALRQERISEGANRRAENAEYFERARALAAQAGMNLVQHTPVHYGLWCPKAGWLLNIYPGNRRLYHDRKYKKPPFLKVRPDWNLFDVVEAAVNAFRNGNGLEKEIEAKTAFTIPKLLVSDEEVRTRAYHLWEAAGRPETDGKEFWYQAERELRGS
jgi:hypothetical protein